MTACVVTLTVRQVPHVAAMAESRSHLDWPRLLHEALTAPGNVGNTYNRFYTYSFLNQMYLRMQHVHEPVATYKRWQAIGRQVIRGAKARTIIKPLIVPVENEVGEKEPKLVGFKPIPAVFPLSETTGKDLPPADLPGWEMATAFDKLGIIIAPFTALNGNVQGYSVGTEIAINPVAVRPQKTLFHEVGHVILGHTLPSALAEYATHRGTFEFQAETVAYLAMHELGQLDEASATVSRGYIQEWLNGEQPSDKAIQQVFTATDRMLKAGRLAMSGDAEP